MIRIATVFCFAMVFLTALKIEAQKQDLPIYPTRFVNLKEERGRTIFKNSTPDTVKLSGMFFNSMPYHERNFAVKIAPGVQDTLEFQFAFPDFIFVNQLNAIYNGPGGRVFCDIKSLKNKAVNLEFKGDFALENKYYLAYYNYLGSKDNEGRPYYTIGDKLKDFNKFPAMADSLTQIRLNFLAAYQQPLSPWFKKHEEQRLIYNGIMRKYNVLASKEFYGGKPMPVNATYYNFEKDLKLVNNEMMINTEYLWATDFYLYKQSKKIHKPVPDAMIYLIDSLCGKTETGDVLKMQRLSKLFMTGKAKYDSEYTITTFYNPVNKIIIDSLIQTKLGLPKIGAKAPDVVLNDINGKQVSLSNYAGQTIIINFWATWCGPCIAEFLMENKLNQVYKSKGLTIINICVDSEQESWKQVSKRNNLQMINLFADSESYKAIKAKFNIGSLPRSILVDKNFKVTDNYYKRASLISVSDLGKLLKN